MPSTSPTGKFDDTSPEELNAGACPIVEALDLIGSKWRLVVLHELAESEYRFNQLKRATGASSRTLSRVLDDLQDAGLVARRVEDEPIATYYSLTERGEALCPVFANIEAWADEWLETDEATAATAD